MNENLTNILNQNIKETKKVKAEICTRVTKVDKEKNIAWMDSRYSNLVTLIISQLNERISLLESLLGEVEHYKKLLKDPNLVEYKVPSSSLNQLRSFISNKVKSAISKSNTDFFAKLTFFIQKFEFTPLLATEDFKDVFTPQDINNTDMPTYVSNNIDSILNFSLMSNKVISSNEIFADGLILSQGLANGYSNGKEYYLPLKVQEKLREVSRKGFSATKLVAECQDGKFDQKCEEALEDKKRYLEACEAARMRRAITKQSPLERLFHGLF